jgi:GDP/UDP-N,N'-diacetylbacillosamine 2-epimerase (hydrolysing)
MQNAKCKMQIGVPRRHSSICNLHFAFCNMQSSRARAIHSPPAAPPKRHTSKLRNVCFVTGTRAEFGLMQSVLRAVKASKSLKLQLIATGMHLDSAHGDSLASIRRDGWDIDHLIPWERASGRDQQTTARNTGLAVAAMADAFAQLNSQIVLVVGDRVEASAAATAAHLSGRIVAHVHGGDRAPGQVDDSLRHAISKLAHVHFPATRQSAQRLHKLGEDRWRIHQAGSPGLDGIVRDAASRRQVTEVFGPLKVHHYALLILHPIDADEATEMRRAQLVLRAASTIPYDRIIVVYPNNDPGSGGIIRCWDSTADQRCILKRDLRRPLFLGLLRDAAVLIGNSSSGIIEAASFGTPVLDIGPRQKGREHGTNVIHVPYSAARICQELSGLWNRGKPKRFAPSNIYEGRGAAKTIVWVLSRLRLDDRLRRKLIVY